MVIISYLIEMKGTTITVMLTVVLILIIPVLTKRSFCSIYCRLRNCNNGATTSCTSCNANWVPAANGSCIPNSNTNYYIADTTPDIGGTLVVSPNATNSASCDTYSVYGWVSTQTVTVSYPTGIIPSFFSMTIYFGIVTTDSEWQGSGSGYWRSKTAFFLSATDASLALNVQTFYLLYGSTRSTGDQYCFRQSRDDNWNKISQTYNFAVSNSPLTFSLRYNQTNTSALWGIRQFIIIYRGCNWACTICYGPSASQCTACLINTTLTIWISGNTCNQTCLTGYGYTNTIGYCILCDPHCSVCFEALDNCSACTTYGTYVAYWYSVNNSCLNPCPPLYFMNKTSHTCDPCNVNCTGCINTANYCTECVTNWGWYMFTCYSPCPTGTYTNPNLTNCTACSPYCQICIGPDTLCTVCTTTGPYIAYLYNATNLTGVCMRTCPQGNYSENFGGAGPNLCLPCATGCFYCTGSPTPCQQCIEGWYLYQSSCVTTCPSSTFASNATGTGMCLDCNVVCVSLQISMYFANTINTLMYIDMQFSQSLNFSSFNYQTFQSITISSSNQYYSLDMFSVTYKILGSTSYRIILQPIGYIFLYNATFTVTTEAQPNATDYSLILMPFKPSCYLQTASLSWFLIQGPPFSSLEINLMTSFSTLSSKTNNFLTLPYVQQIKKSGIFNLLFSGAQITSCSVLSNQIQSQNMYQGVRFWAIFVFFDVPAYQRISNQTKTFVSPSVESQIRNALAIDEHNGQDSKPRSLFSTDTMYWRFQRTGQTSFFIFDCYIPAFLIALCWAGLIVVYCGRKKKWYTLYAGKVYSAVHKIHEISILYVTMAAIVEFIYFEPTSAERFVSAIICILFNVYFILYQLYIYYDMLKYPMAQIGNKLYDYYVIRYGCFLKNVRYEQYDINEQWSPRHWFRPYNFHFLSYYKKFVMMICLPLFYSTNYAQMAILFFIQLLQLIRVWKVWPFLSKRRNILRISLQIALAAFFLINIIQNYLILKIQAGNINEMGDTISVFYGLGWAGFLLVFYFNITHIVIGLYDLCVGFRISNRVKMDNARKKYYYSKIKQYQKDNESASKDLVNRWVKQGNLNNQYFGQLPQINVRIQQYTMRMLVGKFQITVRKISSLRMLKKRNHRKKNNTVTNSKIEKTAVIVQHKHPELYKILHAFYETKANVHIETVVLKTFINVFQPDFGEDEEVPMDRSNMFQRVDLISYDNEKQEENIPSLLEGFPLPAEWFDNL